MDHAVKVPAQLGVRGQHRVLHPLGRAGLVAPQFNSPQHKIFQNKLLPISRAEPRYSSQMLKAVSDGLQASMFSGKSGTDAAKLAADGVDRFLATYKGAH
jgi:hypothetical protein